MRNHKWKKGDHVGFLGGSKTSIVHAVDGDTITIRNTDGTLEKIRGISSYLIAERNDIASQALPEHMIEDLRRNYETIDKIDPVQPTYVKLIGLLDKLPQSALKQLASAKDQCSSATSHEIESSIQRSPNCPSSGKISTDGATNEQAEPRKKKGRTMPPLLPWRRSKSELPRSLSIDG